MNNLNTKIKKWLWLAYPAIVVVFIVISAQYLFLDQTKWASLIVDQQKVQEQETKVAELKAKLSALSSVDLAAETANLKFVLGFQPASKAVWVLVSELKAAATSSGMEVLGFKGGIGEVREASSSATGSEGSSVMVLTVKMKGKDLNQLKMFLANLDNNLPLVRINKIDFGVSEKTIEVEGAWAPWITVAGDNNPIPQYQAEITKLKERLAGFESLPEAVGVTSPSGKEVSPF